MIPGTVGVEEANYLQHHEVLSLQTIVISLRHAFVREKVNLSISLLYMAYIVTQSVRIFP